MTSDLLTYAIHDAGEALVQLENCTPVAYINPERYSAIFITGTPVVYQLLWPCSCGWYSVTACYCFCQHDTVQDTTNSAHGQRRHYSTMAH